MKPSIRVHFLFRFWFMTGSTVVVSQDIMKFIANGMPDRWVPAIAGEEGEFLGLLNPLRMLGTSRAEQPRISG